VPLTFFPEPEAIEKDVRLKARAFAERTLRVTAIADDESGTFRREYFTEAGALGFAGMMVPAAYSGQGQTSHAFYSLQEELARGSAAFGVAAGVTNLPQGAILEFGSTEQKKKWLPPLAKGQWLGAFSLSEPQSGSDAAGLRLAAKKVAGGYRLNGTKLWCSNAGLADCYLVMARTGVERYKGVTAFVVLKDTPGFRVGKQEKKMGLRASTLAELIFEDAFVPESHRIGAEGQGFEVALTQLDSGRISIAAAGLGLAIESLERVWQYLLDRKKRGFEVNEGDKILLADHYAMAQSIRLSIREAARLKDSGMRFSSMASQVKLLGSDLAVRTASDVVMLMGELGYTREAEVERLLRDAKALQIVEGTNQIQRTLLAREMENMMAGAKK
jgi:alkylation response protein AidB-like acyl-CoA dehydrogenase